MEEKELTPEKSMEEPDLNEAELSSLNVDYSNDIDRALSQLISLNPSNVIHEVTCFICNSPYRKEIEEKWISVKSNKKAYKEIIEFVKEKTDVQISGDMVNNHMTYHYDRGIKELQKTEYLERIKRLNSIEITTMDRLKLCLSALTERLMSVNSITPGGDLSDAEIEKIKTTETVKIMNSINQLLKLRGAISGEILNNGELITLPREAFVRIFNETLTSVKSDGEKQLVRNILDKLMELNNLVK